MFELQRETYEKRYGVRFVDRPLGDGKDGLVVMHEAGNAVKFLSDRDNYTRELRAYRVLDGAKVDAIAGHHVPRFLRSDDELLAIEMTVVAPPFLLDFVATYTDEELERLGFSEEVLVERQTHWAEIFGDRWHDVVGVRNAFHAITGLHLLDLSLNNIRFA